MASKKHPCPICCKPCWGNKCADCRNGRVPTSKASTRPEKVAFVTGDRHYPDHDPAAVACAGKALEHIKPDIFIDGGDLSEGAAVSHWEWRNKKKPPVEYQRPKIDAELVLVNEELDKLDASLDRAGIEDRRILLGNHDDWYDRFADENDRHEDYRPKKAMHLDTDLVRDGITRKSRGYHVEDFGKYTKLGKLYIHHGHDFHVQFHSKKYVQEWGVNVMYFHHHTAQTFMTRHIGGPHRAWSVGMLGNKDKQFKRNKTTTWIHQFAIVHVMPSGWFDVQVHDIHKGVAYVWGEVITA